MRNLTDVGIRNLKPKPDPQEIKDPSCPGLRVRCTPKGVKTFLYSYSHPVTKQMKRIKLGTYPVMGLADARAEWNRLSAIRHSGIDPRQYLEDEKRKAIPAAEIEIEIISVQQLINIYIDEYSSKYKKSWREDMRVLNKEVATPYGKLSAHELSKEQMKTIVGMKRDAGHIPQAGHIISTTRALYNWAIDDEDSLFKANPFTVNPAERLDGRRAKKLFKMTPRKRTLNEAELRVIIPLLPACYKDLLRLTLLTGCRIGEACNMEWHDVYLDEWRIPEEKTKNGHPHTVYLSPQALAILESQEKETNYVWANPRSNTGHIRTEGVAGKIRVNDWKGVAKFTPHDLRRTLSTWLGENLASKEINDRMLNHVTGGVYETYNRAKYNVAAREWWIKWSDHLEGLGL